MKIKYLVPMASVSPIHVGDERGVTVAEARRLIKAGYAEAVVDPKAGVETATARVAADSAKRDAT